MYIYYMALSKISGERKGNITKLNNHKGSINYQQQLLKIGGSSALFFP